MTYQALSFIYDDVPSEKFGVFLCNQDTGLNSFNGGGNVDIVTERASQDDVNHIVSIDYNKVFEFELMFGREEAPDKHMISLINTWLIGHQNYKELRIVQKDMSTVYYRCIMTDFEICSIGNVPYAFKCSVICDRPYGIGNTQVYTYTIKDGVNNLILRNTSNTTGITLPRLTFTTNGSDECDLKITNLNNNSYETIFTSLAENETIVLDCKLQKISSSTGARRLSNFNKHWLELVPNLNKLQVEGNVSNIKIEYKPIKKMG